MQCKCEPVAAALVAAELGGDGNQGGSEEWEVVEGAEQGGARGTWEKPLRGHCFKNLTFVVIEKVKV